MPFMACIKRSAIPGINHAIAGIADRSIYYSYCLIYGKYLAIHPMMKRKIATRVEAGMSTPLDKTLITLG